MKPAISEERKMAAGKARRWQSAFRHAPEFIEYCLAAAVLGVAAVPWITTSWPS